jgi:hypothetical protein
MIKNIDSVKLVLDYESVAKVAGNEFLDVARQAIDFCVKNAIDLENVDTDFVVSSIGTQWVGVYRDNVRFGNSILLDELLDDIRYSDNVSETVGAEIISYVAKLSEIMERQFDTFKQVAGVELSLVIDDEWQIYEILAKTSDILTLTNSGKKLNELDIELRASL